MKVTDPVCGMSIESEKAHASETYEGRSYYFCSAQCQRSFKAEPAKFALKAAPPGGEAGRGGHPSPLRALKHAHEPTGHYLDIYRCDMILKGTMAMRSRLLLPALLATLAFSAPYAVAQTAPHTPPKPPETAADMDKQMAQMQENVKRMQRQMDRIHEAKDPKERHELMDEHGKTMQENMRMLRGMGGPTMMDTMGGGHTGGMGPGMTGGGRMEGDPMGGMDPKQQQEFMQRRMDMMQMMMEQIMRHQLLMQAAPAK